MTKVDWTGTAKFDTTSVYRYVLTREWEDGEGTLVVICLNPSTATADVNDPTVRRCIGFARPKHGRKFRKLVILNIFALRSTDPDALYTHADPIGPENDRFILEEAKRGDCVVVAWGCHGAHRGRGLEVVRLLHGIQVKCFGTTKDGFPKHPLYLAASTPLIPYSARASA